MTKITKVERKSMGFTLVNFDTATFEHYETYDELVKDLEDLLASDLIGSTGQEWLDQNILVFIGMHEPLPLRISMKVEVTPQTEE
jgi:hypothetical protein